MCFVQVYFSQFGAVKDVTILTDHVTQRSRGFGFVVYEDPNSVNAVLSHRYHELDGRKAQEKKLAHEAGLAHKRCALLLDGVTVVVPPGHL